MITPWVADLFRLANAVGSFALIIAACGAVRYCDYADQRVRFALFGLFGALLTAGHLTTLGQPGPYRLPMLTVVVALAIWSTIKFVMREQRTHREDK